MALLSDSNIASMRDVAYDLRGQAVTVKVPIARSVDYTTGDITKSFTSTAVSKALLGPVKTLNGADKARSCHIRVSDVASITTDCYVTIDSVDWFVKAVRFDSTEYAHRLSLETNG